jgi:hypothetical protein
MTRDRPRPPRSDGSGQLYAVLPRELGDVLPADTEGVALTVAAIYPTGVVEAHGRIMWRRPTPVNAVTRWLHSVTFGSTVRLPDWFRSRGFGSGSVTAP